MKAGPIASLLLAACILAIPPAAQSAPTADEIMQKNFFASKPKRVFQEVTMTLVNERNETRLRKITSLISLQANGFDTNILVRFLAPPDVKGTSFLQIEHAQGEDDQWIFLPALHKSRRLVSSNRKDSFIGSDFSYGDVIPPKVSLYQHKLLREETVGTQPCYVVESVPVNDDVKRDYGYGRKITWVALESFFEMKTEYYDVTGRLLKTQLVKDIVKVDAETNRWLAKYKEMTNRQTNHKTVITVDRYTTATSITSATYTLRALEND
ncbi:MAG: outer membrane lipoprotein-sorting protein [Rhodoferax sp.]|uniref:outer membrane lipoprotein-sorting protein n=1 Tax=Rhodoferax sp. TaxID=50421 RepID=UPI0026052E22|nr:outer membrane lipoprotein-sorting protein [Rhodoferax sp.]MDD5332811.1 outer membrane lipoprotein-sorting protein [Rhodoferax sp.]